MIRAGIILLLVLFFSTCIYGQENPTDSLQVYRDIETYAKRKKGIIYTLYRSVFRPVAKKLRPSKKKARGNLRDMSFDKYEGRVIRNITIDNTDPFGFVIGDTSVYPKSFVQNFGNRLHARTKKGTIRNKLLFKPNSYFDALLIKESERLLRQTSYIREAKITPIGVGKDSVDIVVRTIDMWSIVARLSVTPKTFKIRLVERNLLGLGHGLDNTFYDNSARGTYAYEGIYSITNIKNSFINTNLYFTKNESYQTTVGINIERLFYSPVVKYAGGISFFESVTSSTFIATDTSYTFDGVKYDQLDVWGGKSWRLERGASEEKRTGNIVATARYLNINYRSRPYFDPDTLRLLQNQQFYFFGLGITKRKYFKDEYLFKFGSPEEVPVGGVAAVITGYQNRENDFRYYVGGRIGYGKYFLPGYASLNIEYGTFLNKSKPEQGTISADLVYFTNLGMKGKWRFRQFFKSNLLWGIKRFPTDIININDDNGLQGFNSDLVTGTKKLVFTTQTQVYTPYDLIGFRFAPVLYLACAFISDDGTNLFTQGGFYTSFGLGLLIKNELLVLNTFQISIAFYPVIPGLKNNVLKINPVKTYDFQFRDFDMEKPYLVGY